MLLYGPLLCHYMTPYYAIIWPPIMPLYGPLLCHYMAPIMLFISSYLSIST